MRERFNNMFAFARHMLLLAARAWVCEAFSLQTIFKTNCENSEIYFLPYFSTHSPCACDNFSHTFPSRALFFGRKAFWSSLNFGRSRNIYRRRRRLQFRVEYLLGTKQLLRLRQIPGSNLSQSSEVIVN